MQLHNLFAVHSDTFRHVQETFDVPLSPTQPYNPGSYDVCLVIPLRRKEMSMETVHMLERVISTCGRKYVYMYNDETDTKRFVLIRGGSTRLRSKAEQTGTKLPLDDRQCLLLAQEGYPESNIAPIRIAHTPQLTPFRPFEYLFARYVTRDDKVEALYRTVATDADYADAMGGGGGGGGLFPKADRIRLLDRMLNDSEADDGADANTRQQLQDGLLLGYFPLHANEPAGEGTFAHDLVSWAVLPWHKPLDELNEYFGSRIAFYLAFLNHVCGWLIAPALVGAGCQAAAVALNNYSRPEIPVFAFFIAVWAVLVREHWRRQEKLLGMRWNSLDEPDGSGGGGGGGGSGSVAAAAAALLDSARDARPQFRGILLDHSHIDGKPLLYRRHGSALRTALVASVSVAVIALACVGVAAAIYVVRWLLYYTPVGRFNQFVSSGINAVTIQLLQYAFRGLAVALADLENHRTDDEYYASLTVKMVLFSFVNNFTAFYYLAFGARYLPQGGNKDSVGMCGYDDCMVAVGINLAALFGVRLVVGLFLFRALPFLRHAWNHGHCSCLHCYYTARRLVLACAYRLFLCRPYYAEDDDVQNEYELRVAEAQAAEEEKQGGNAELGQLGSYDQKLEDWGFSRAEWEYLLPEYDTHRLTFQLADQMITFGQMTLFVAALPGAPLLGLIFYSINFNADCWMLLRRFRRPFPSKASGLGHYWNACLGLFVGLAVATNAALVAFTMQTLDSQGLTAKLGVFVAFQYAVFALQFAVQTFLPATPAEVAIQLARQQVVQRKLIDRVPDKHKTDPRGDVVTPVAVL